MLPLPALLLIAPPGPIPPPPGAEVIIDERVLSLPALPVNADQARQGNARIQASVGNGIADLEKSLEASNALLATQPPLGPSLSVPKDRAEEGRFLEAWNGWQSALVGAGVDQRIKGQSRASCGEIQKRQPQRADQII